LERFDALRSSSRLDQCCEFNRLRPFRTCFDHAPSPDDELRYELCVAFQPSLLFSITLRNVSAQVPARGMAKKQTAGSGDTRFQLYEEAGRV
jgi:hypothetical protein